MSVARIATPGLTFDETAHSYRVDRVEVPSVTQVLKDNRLAGDFSAVPPATLEHARQRGAAVHAATHYLDEDDLDAASVSPEVWPYVQAWIDFKAARRVRIEALEQRVACRDFRVAGTIDRVAWVPGIGQVLIDIKTGSIEGAAYQLAGYKLLANHLKPLVPSTFRLARWAVALHPSLPADHVHHGVPYTVHEYRDSRDKDVFLAALSLTHERARLGRHWLEAAA